MKKHDFLKVFIISICALISMATNVLADEMLRDVNENSEGDEIVSQETLEEEADILNIGGSENEIVETVLIEAEEEEDKKDKKKKRSAMDTGNKFGIAAGVNFRLVGMPTLLQEYFIEIPFSRYLVATASVALDYHSITNHIDTERNYYVTNGNGTMEFLMITLGAKIYVFNKMPIGVGFMYDHYIKGSIESIYSATNASGTSVTNKGGSVWESIKILDADNMLSLYLTVGYLAEIKENVFILPEGLFSFRLTGGIPAKDESGTAAAEEFNKGRFAKRFNFGLKVSIGFKL